MINRGRKTIYSSESEITRDNVQRVVTYAMQTHELNRKDIKYLIEYEKGRQDILDREKPVRPEINEKIVENHRLLISRRLSCLARQSDMFRRLNRN